jgi:hypothetical protein
VDALGRRRLDREETLNGLPELVTDLEDPPLAPRPP